MLGLSTQPTMVKDFVRYTYVHYIRITPLSYARA